MSDEPEENAEAAAERLLTNQQWPIVVTLQHPIEFGSERIASLSFNRGKMGDLKGVTVGGMPTTEQLMLLAKRLCGQPIEVIERIDPDDVSEVLAIALGFIYRCQRGGRKR
jgi:hypothetical protein